MRRAARTDRNHSEIVRGLRRSGCTVLDLSAVGEGCPDALVGRCGYNWLMEFKDGNKKPSERKLRDKQIKFFDTWRGNVTKVESLQEAIDVINETLRKQRILVCHSTKSK